ncbi:MAG: hypothetical protein H0X29_09945, partial [Parachlamydiaceae bacterium]|nr:hypothetical protein [Parachlamydiaceae bacterium]
MACFCAWVYLNSDYAKPQITRAIDKSLSELTGSNVSVNSFSFSFPTTLTLSDIALSETETPWLTAKNIHVSFSPKEIMHGKIAIKSLEIDDLHLLSLPPSKHSEKTAFSLNSLNFSSLPLTLEQIKINSAKLSPEVSKELNLFPKHYSKELQLYATLYPDFPNGSVNATLLLGSSADAKESFSNIKLSLKQQDEKLSCTFDIHESKTGLLSEVSNYPFPDDLLLQGNITSSLVDLQSLLEGIVDTPIKKSLEASFSVQFGKDIHGLGKLSLFSNRSVHLAIEEATYGPLDIDGHISLSPNQSLKDTEINIISKNVALLGPWTHPSLSSISGACVATCRLTGFISEPSAFINFQTDELAYETIHSQKINGEVEIHYKVDRCSGKAHLATSLENKPIEASGVYEWIPGNSLSLSDLSISGYESIGKGTLTYEQNTGWLEANVRGTTNFSAWNNWLPEPV